MLTTAIFTSLKLGRPFTIYQILTLDSNASLTVVHVVSLHQTDLENGTFLVEQQLFQSKVRLHHFIETEEMMEQST